MPKASPARQSYGALEFNLPNLVRVTHPIPKDVPSISLGYYGT